MTAETSIQPLLDKIKREGIEEANKAAEEILEQARFKAENILREGEAKAQKEMSEATAEIEKKKQTRKTTEKRNRSPQVKFLDGIRFALLF